MWETLCKKTIVGVIVVTLSSVSLGCGPAGQWTASDFFKDKSVIALAKAAEAGDVKEIDRLVAAGVDVNTQGKDGMTPLLYALWTKNEKGFEHLLKKGANPSLPHKDGDTITHVAALDAKSSGWLRILIRHKANINVVNPKGVVDTSYRRTPLYYAINGRNVDNLKLLLAAGADPNHQDAGGATPAMHAGGRNFWEGVEILLEAGADWKVRDKGDQDLAMVCFRRKPADKFEKSVRARKNVIVFLTKKGVDLAAAKERVMRLDGSVEDE